LLLSAAIAALNVFRQSPKWVFFSTPERVFPLINYLETRNEISARN